MRTRREVGAKSAAGEPAVRHTAEGSATLMRLASRLFRGNRTSVSADCRRLDHGKIATVRLGGLSRKSTFSSTANMWWPLHDAGAPLRSGTHACRSGGTASNPELDATPARQPSVRSGSAPDRSRQQHPQVEECCVIRLLCNYDRSDGDILNLNTEVPRREMPGVCCPDRWPSVPALCREPGLMRYRENADPVLDSTKDDGSLACATHSTVV
jgi:hypothetical protein